MSRNMFTKVVALALVAVFALTAAVPALAAVPCPGCVAKGRFVVKNNSDKPTFIWLYGEYKDYALTVPAHTTKTFTIYVGDYAYKVTGCDTFTTRGTFTQKKGPFTFVQPACGAKMKSEDKNLKQITLGSTPPKLVKVTIFNPLSVAVTLTMMGNNGLTYYLPLAAGSTGTFTIGRGSYKIKCSACNIWGMWKNVSVSNNHYTIPCP